MSDAKTGTRGRRIKDEPQALNAPLIVNGIDIMPTIVSSDMLDHGLNSGDDIYVWANRQSSLDLSGKMRTGFTFVKYDDVKKMLADQGRPIVLYAQDTEGNLTYGTELVLMKGSRRVQNELIRRALNEQTSAVADASVSDLSANIDDLLSHTPIKKGQRVSVSTDEDHGSKTAMTISREEN